jgi:hypothetical protein
MLARKGVFWSFGRAIALTAVVGMALTTAEPSLALAGSASPGKGPSLAAPSSEATDFSARRRYYHYRRNGGAAAAAAAVGIIGLGLGIAAAQNRRAYYDDYYYGGPAYYGPGPYYYGRGPYYYGW